MEVDTTLNYYALAYCILGDVTSQKALAEFEIREMQDHTRQCRYIQCAEKVKDMIVNKGMKKVEVMRELGISRDILNEALKYAKVPTKDYRKK